MTELTPLKTKKWTSEEISDLSGKLYIVTGANSGLGLEATKELLMHNATVIMACRNLEKSQKEVDEIKQTIQSGEPILMKLDLSDLESVKSFVNKFKAKYDRLDGLINNAGIMQPPRMETKQGFEIQIGVNHLGHYALTGLLLDVLKRTPHSRVITQSSIAARQGKINFDDLNFEEHYGRTKAYSQSKLANMIFALELDRRLKENKIENVSSISVHPGYTDTNLQHNGPTVGGKSFLSRLYTVTNKVMAQDVSMGILPMLYAATEDDVEGGDVIAPQKMMNTRGHPKRVKPYKQAKNEETAEKLWKISEELTGIKYPFK